MQHIPILCVTTQPRRAELSKTQGWFEEAFIPGEKTL